MAWLESHQTLANHPKTLKLSRLLNVPRVTVIGHLHFLWWWALDYAQDGDLSKFDELDIAVAADWQGEPDVFLSSLKRAGFINDDGTIHDWHEYAGRLIERRRADAERKRGARKTTSAEPPAPNDERPEDVQRMSGGNPEDGVRNLTVPNRTEPNPTEEDAPHPPEGELDEPGYTQEFEDFWRDYPRVVNNSKLRAFRAWRGLKEPSRRAARDALPIFLASDGWQRGFAPHTSTYLNGRLWEAEQPDKPAQLTPIRGGKNNDPQTMLDLSERYRRAGQ